MSNFMWIMLPLCRKFIKAATGNKSTRLKLQMMIVTQIDNLTINLIYIMIPTLLKDCIIGIDCQKKLNMLTKSEVKSIKIR